MYQIDFLFWLSITSTVRNQCEYMCRPEVRRFQEFVAINTTVGVDTRVTVDFWRRLAREEDVEFQVYEYVENYPIIVLKYPGLNSSLSSIVLNGHFDVVPANYEDGWTYPPFAGSINDQCEVVGRGTQDMKSNLIQYFEAMNRLKNNNVQLLRDVYIVLTPDATAGSANGAELFVKSQEFQDMNVGFVFDLGVSDTESAVTVFYQDKAFWGLRVDCYGQTTISGLLLKRNVTAEGSCSNFYLSTLRYKESEYKKYQNNPDFSCYTLINLVGGCNSITYTVNPAHITMYYSITLDRGTSVQEFNKTLQEWACNAGGEITLTTEVLIEKSPATSLDYNNPYWVALQDVFDELNIQLKPLSSPVPTDGNSYARAGVPVLGFTPQPNTPFLLFDVNERLSIRTFLQGIYIYEKVIQRVANLTEDEVGDDPKKYLSYSDY